MSEIVMIIERCAHALGNAVVQSLWQCALVGALAAAVAMCSRRAAVRYGVWCAGMLACAAWFALTFAAGVRVERPLELAGYAGGLRGGVVAGGPEAGSSGVVGAASVGLFEIVAMLWLCGFAFVSVRFVLQWRAAQLLRTRGLVAAGAEWQALFDDVRGVFGVSRRVCLRVSERARCPMVVGVLVPVVVVPASVLLMLSPAQVRMVLAHELAHVRRYDHVVNMLQVLIETVMFYHLVVWWMSRQARVEREHCCDDAAVRMCGDAVAYARALTELEEVRLQSRAVLGLQGGSLMKRINRLVGHWESERGAGSAHALTAVMVLIVACGGVYAYSTMRAQAPEGDEVIAFTVRDDSRELILHGVSDEALDMRRKTELGSISYYEQQLRPRFLEDIRSRAASGLLTREEAEASIDLDASRQLFESRWFSVGVMYQQEVIEGRMTVDEANRLLERALKENGYAASEFAQADPMLGMQVVAADHVFDVMVTPDGKPVGAELELELKAVEPGPEKKLTPMDDAYFYHQGIRALSEYEEENPDDC